MTTKVLLLWWKDKFCKIELKEQGISHKLRIPRSQSFNLHGFGLSIKGTRSDQDHGVCIYQAFYVTFFNSVFVYEHNLCQMLCSVISFVQNIFFHQTKIFWWFESLRYLYPTTLLKHLNTFPAELCCASIGKYETMINVTTNLVVTLRLSWP